MCRKARGYAPYVNWALANGIVSGTSAVTFSPDASITRQDMAVMLYSYTQRYQVHLQQQPVTPFTDADSIAAYAQVAVQTLQRAGVISGMPDGSFQPYGTATANRPAPCCACCNAQNSENVLRGARRTFFHVLRAPSQKLDNSVYL